MARDAKRGIRPIGCRPSVCPARTVWQEITYQATIIVLFGLCHTLGISAKESNGIEPVKLAQVVESR